jgi:acetyl-CoA carboxylase carboxyltransferase component
MLTIPSRISPSDETFRFNRERMQLLVQQLRDRVTATRQGGGPKYLQRHREQGKLPVRERVDLLLITNRPAQAVALAACDTRTRRPGRHRHGHRPRLRPRGLIVANDATVKGGTYYPMTVKSTSARSGSRRKPAALRVSRRLGGAFLPMQAEVFPDREHFGRIFFNQARMSAEKIPQIAVVMGSCTAGGACAAMSDETIIVNGTGTIFLGGPPLVSRHRRGHRGRTGRSRRPHATLRCRRLLRRRRAQALKLCRTIVTTLHAGGRRASSADMTPVEEPKCDPSEIRHRQRRHPQAV